MKSVLDEYGLVVPGEHLVAFIPATNKALVFRVLARINKGYEVYNYGPLPLAAGESLNSYDGGTVSVPADGVIPARGYVPIEKAKTFPTTEVNVFDTSDMWYVPYTQHDTLFHVIQYLTPDFLRCEALIPTGVSQARFQAGKVTLGIAKDWGFTRGKLEIIHFPQLHIGYLWGNDSNMNLYTNVKFLYGEYKVAIPKDASLIFDLITRKIPSAYIVLPINFYDSAIDDALIKTYGYNGFPVYPVTERGEAISEYESILRGVLI